MRMLNFNDPVLMSTGDIHQLQDLGVSIQKKQMVSTSSTTFSVDSLSMYVLYVNNGDQSFMAFFYVATGGSASYIAKVLDNDLFSVTVSNNTCTLTRSSTSGTTRASLMKVY